MKKILSKNIVIICVLMFSGNALSVTHSCTCQIEKVHAGFVGGTGNSIKSRVDCSNGKSYALGKLNDDLAKARHSMALAAQMASRNLVLQYWSSDGSLNCDVASSGMTLFPHGLYTE